MNTLEALKKELNETYARYREHTLTEGARLASLWTQVWAGEIKERFPKITLEREMVVFTAQAGLPPAAMDEMVEVLEKTRKRLKRIGYDPKDNVFRFYVDP